MKFSIIIPCFNEREGIDDLINRVSPLQKEFDLEYVLVENGSTDSSKEYFKTKIDNKFDNIRVVYVENNIGYGYGLQQGMKAAQGDYIGWIHADLQVDPGFLIDFFEYIENSKRVNLFLKGRRLNRSVFDKFFTNGQAVFNSLLFKERLYDVGAIPVLFSKKLIENCVDSMPNDFSIELYVYEKAVRDNYYIKRLNVRLINRTKGSSSWNHGLKSKLRQSVRIFKDSLKIKKGEKVL